MITLQFNPYQCRVGTFSKKKKMQSGGGSKKSKPIPAPPHGAGLKFCSIPTAPLLQDGKNLHGVK